MSTIVDYYTLIMDSQNRKSSVLNSRSLQFEKYPNCSIIPKMHFMTNYPEQDTLSLAYGLLMDYEAESPVELFQACITLA